MTLRPAIALLFLLTGLTRAQSNQPATAASDAIFTAPEFWEKGPAAFEGFFKDAGFRWTSTRKESLRTTGSGLIFAGVPVVESLVWMKADRPAEVVLSLYNRGDCPVIDEQAFLGLLRNAQKNITTLSLASSGGSAPAQFNGFPPKRQVWKLRTLALVMEWDSSSKTRTNSNFQAEFLRVRVLPAALLESGAADQQVSAFATTLKKVTSLENGDVYLADVPMVDQGPKGYCAVAATERVLRYYGAVFDQHQLAQIAGTDAGTDPSALAKALERAAGKLRISVNIIDEFSVAQFLQLVKTYNANARRAGKTEIDLPASGVIDIGSIYAGMDPAVLIETRTRNPTGMNKFTERIEQHVKSRTPLIWGVMLGLVEEPNLPQTRGGHLRLIIGFNAKTKELLYTDSWGAGHELKRMPLPQAFAITTTLFAIKPK